MASRPHKTQRCPSRASTTARTCRHDRVAPFLRTWSGQREPLVGVPHVMQGFRAITSTRRAGSASVRAARRAPEPCRVASMLSRGDALSIRQPRRECRAIVCAAAGELGIVGQHEASLDDRRVQAHRCRAHPHVGLPELQNGHALALKFLRSLPEPPRVVDDLAQPVPVASTTAPVRVAVGCASCSARRRPSGGSSCAAAVLIASSLESRRSTSPVCIASRSCPSGHAHSSVPM